MPGVEHTAPCRRAHFVEGEYASQRLWYSPLAPEHMALYVELYTDAGVMRHIGPPLTEARAQRAFNAAVARSSATDPGAAYWAIGPGPGTRAIGINALVVDPGGISAEIGTLVVPQEQGKGYASEAVAALVERVFVRSALESIRVTHAVGHLAVPRVLRRTGFVLEATRGGVCHWRLTGSAWRAGAFLQPDKR